MAVDLPLFTESTLRELNSGLLDTPNVLSKSCVQVNTTAGVTFEMNLRSMAYLRRSRSRLTCGFYFGLNRCFIIQPRKQTLSFSHVNC